MCADRKSRLRQKPAGISDSKTDVVLCMYTWVCVCIENSVGGHRGSGDSFVSEERDSQENVFLEAHSRLKNNSNNNLVYFTELNYMCMYTESLAAGMLGILALLLVVG